MYILLEQGSLPSPLQRPKGTPAKDPAHEENLTDGQNTIKLRSTLLKISKAVGSLLKLQT